MKKIIAQPGSKKDVADFLEKVVINAGVGRLSSQPGFEEKALPQVVGDISLICGQKPHTRQAKKSIAGFKVREGQIVGLRATLRGKRMVDFFERMIKIVLPRVKDFRGLNISSVDGGGALNIGVREQYVFPEIVPERSLVAFSLEISFIPRVRRREEAIKRYGELGVPLKKQ